MSSLLKIEWTILNCDSPLANRPCSRCKAIREFVSTGKFRLNANGSRLDAWLIFSCVVCGKRWNKSLFERRPVKNISHEQLEALQSNDRKLAERLALECSNSDAARSCGFTLDKHVSGRVGGPCDEVLLRIRNPAGGRIRLDQVLARGLGLSRKDIHRLVVSGVLRIDSPSGKAIRRPVPGEIEIALSCATASRDLLGRLQLKPTI
ncbi:DUF1062 domain-containing protein [Labrenzia sp. 011]|uniref:DUF1062 domain-containing protein n=1 Tax=Labrenzia sp. 011 TaxID=2171494 RepID=UPI000D51776B|nr:DUF1062 domain-containing protein [Labrenzia sp. 011]PVB61602.1 hypothetical protein DCO57_10455 [Labrenzia sp. 011]